MSLSRCGQSGTFRYEVANFKQAVEKSANNTLFEIGDHICLARHCRSINGPGIFLEEESIRISLLAELLHFRLCDVETVD